MARPKRETVTQLYPTYIVTDDFRANVNNKSFDHKRGDRIQLTPTEYAVLGRFVLELKGAEQ